MNFCTRCPYLQIHNPPVCFWLQKLQKIANTFQGLHRPPPSGFIHLKKKKTGQSSYSCRKQYKETFSLLIYQLLARYEYVNVWKSIAWPQLHFKKVFISSSFSSSPTGLLWIIYSVLAANLLYIVWAMLITLIIFLFHLFIYFTLGDPKGAMLSHRNVVADAASFMKNVEVSLYPPRDSADSWLSF